MVSTWTSARDANDGWRPAAVAGLHGLLPGCRPGQHCPEVEAEASAEVEILYQFRAAQAPVGRLLGMRRTVVGRSPGPCTRMLVEEPAPGYRRTLQDALQGTVLDRVLRPLGC